MSRCTYTRNTPEGWEYGFIRIEDSGSKNETRHYVRTGLEATYEEAVRANGMALAGQPKVKPHIEPTYRN